MSSVQQRKAEILAKRAKLAELKRQRELRQKEFSQSRANSGDASEVWQAPQRQKFGTNFDSIFSTKIVSPVPSRSDSRAELDDLISRLVDRPGSASVSHADGPSRRGSRPNSVLSASQLSGDNTEALNPTTRAFHQSIAVQTDVAEPFVASSAPPPPPEPKPEVVTYSKGVQTDESKKHQSDSESETEDLEDGTSSSKRHSKRGRERDEEIRRKLRKEIEEELQATQQQAVDGPGAESTNLRYPLRTLDDDELKAVTSSDDFLDFVERSTRVIERALDEEYDVLADYELGGIDGDLEDDVEHGKKRKSIREVCQFYDERWSKKRMISDLSFSPKFPELVLAAYTKNPSAPHEPDGLVQVWNQHLHSRPEYVFHSTSDILTAKFSPFHPNLIVGGSYSGQVLLWDTRSSRAGGGAPVQKTPLTGSGHTHPVYSISIIGTQNAHNILTASTDGVVCGWTVDMLSQPQEYLELATPPPSKTEDLAPTTMSFPQSDPTFFIVGTEEGGIYPCHRYDRAGAKAGTDQRLAYRGHAAPIMSTAFHPARGPVDLGDLMLSSSLDWSVKLWRVRPPATTAPATSAAIATNQVVSPILDLNREDVVYDARWSPHRPGVFSLVDGAGNLEVWDLCTDTEVPVVRTSPSRGRGGILTRSLNKVAWEEREGKRIATGGLDGVVTIFEVGKGLSGTPEDVPAEEWTAMKRLAGKLEQRDRAN
ncbi:putative dynein intermediate chain [Aspergillus clavatus NRRL 1]|uniref:Dynein intermediate chain, putative n=1 Tax=Aspergillus clavatus (strain ATCC 1007 / CBS 513.65 / DSM 816 / NCTC 3887 / NRRL 1 / QM 1276 / 107) TaxID=344612 RepID=A1C3Y7_ASPCL|nr:dynein intermediate chain, putative [Aspergillus clavatus NRRL 1]EAW15127.1 dynein intermediate chain, putative [Aspergillus clavatus NRRL 1]